MELSKYYACSEATKLSRKGMDLEEGDTSAAVKVNVMNSHSIITNYYINVQMEKSPFHLLDMQGITTTFTRERLQIVSARSNLHL